MGPKEPGTTNRGRKKTISLEPNPFLASLQGLSSGSGGDRSGSSNAKRARMVGYCAGSKIFYLVWEYFRMNIQNLI